MEVWHIYIALPDWAEHLLLRYACDLILFNFSVDTLWYVAVYLSFPAYTLSLSSQEAFFHGFPYLVLLWGTTKLGFF